MRLEPQEEAGCQLPVSWATGRSITHYGCIGSEQYDYLLFVCNLLIVNCITVWHFLGLPEMYIRTYRKYYTWKYANK
ncbi:MAG: hypothetical protein ACTHLE_18040 [Agriterribacter sp.]